MVLSVMYYLGGCLSAAAAATTKSEISRREVAVACGVDVGWGLLCYFALYLSGEIRHLACEPGVVCPELVDNPVCLICLDSGQRYQFGGPPDFNLLCHRVFQGRQLIRDKWFDSAVHQIRKQCLHDHLVQVRGFAIIVNNLRGGAVSFSAGLPLD